MTAPLVHAPIRSMVCAGCSGPMLLRKNAVGMESLRCPKCSPFAREPYRHPDDAMLPQGLVKTDAVRVIRQIVRVAAPAPPPERIIELPPIRNGQLRCQLCSHGVEPASRFCDECAPGGTLILKATKLRHTAATGTRARRRYPPKPCTWPVNRSAFGTTLCGETFQPTGTRALYCETHQLEAVRQKLRRARGGVGR